MVGARVRWFTLFAIAILVATVSTRPLESDSTTSVPRPVLIQQTITMTMSDGQGTFPPAPINATENVQVSDAVGVFPPLPFAVSSTVLVADQVGVFPPVGVARSTTLLVADTAGIFPPASLSASETISLSDSVSVSLLVDFAVEGAGDGSGHVTNGGIDCQLDSGAASGVCTEIVTAGTTLFLDATPDAGSAFGGWTGCDVGGTSPSCIVVVSEDMTITAEFDDLVIVKPVVVSPPRVEAPFRVDIVADDVDDLAGADLSLNYDPAVLDFIGARLGTDFGDCSNQSLNTGNAVNLAMVCSTGRSGTDVPFWIATFMPRAGTTENQTTLSVTDLVLGHAGDPPGEIPSVGESTVVEIVLGACGDINRSGVFDIVDLILAMKVIVGDSDPTLTQLILGDLDENGRIDAIDVIIGLQHLVGIVPTLDSCGPPPDPGVVLSE